MHLSAMAGGQVFLPAPTEMQVGTLLIRFGGVAPAADLRPCFKEAITSAKRASARSSKDSGFVMQVPGSNDVIGILANERVNGLDSASLTSGSFLPVME